MSEQRSTGYPRLPAATRARTRESLEGVPRRGQSVQLSGLDHVDATGPYA